MWICKRGFYVAGIQIKFTNQVTLQFNQEIILTWPTELCWTCQVNMTKTGCSCHQWWEL